MYPDIETIKKYADQYKRVPVAIEMYADCFTPVEVLRILRQVSSHCYLLESAKQDDWGRYSFLGFEPAMEITCMDHSMRIHTLASGKEETLTVEHPKTVLRKIISEYSSPQLAIMPPFTGGLVGYFSYDYMKYGEPKLKLSKEDGDFKDLDVMLFDTVICFDHFRQKLILITGVATDQIATSYEQAKERLKKIRELLNKGNEKTFDTLHLESVIKPEFSEGEFVDMVNKAKDYIREGDIFQVVLSNPMRAKARGSLFNAYRILRTQNPSPYMFYFTSNDLEIAGASPETLVKLQDGKLFTFPLAGTSPRGKNEAEDEEFEKKLLADEKERAEHNMLVDLGRNDIGRVAEMGSVKVEKYMAIERFSAVMHIGSTVSGKLRKDKDALDALDSILPAGTLSGAPKLRACEIIEELERSRRGIYGGAIGYLDFAGNMDTGIAIRLVYKRNDEITIRSGAGIVADSIGEKEFRECQYKASAVIKAVKESQEELV